MTFLHQNAPVGELTFPATAPSARASAMFVIRNDTDATLAAITVALDGDPSFAIDPTLSTCVAGPELVPSDLCTVFLRWTAAANATTRLVVTSGKVVSTLTVQGPVGVSSAVVTDASAIDFGIVPVGSSVMIDVHVTNTSAADIPISEFGGAVFRFGGNECPLNVDDVPVVPAGGSCTVGVTFAPTTAGWVEETVGFGDAAVTFDAYRAGLRAITKLGTGTGRIHSVPSGIDCGADCGSQSAYLIGDATLFEEPDGDARFAGWQSTCSVDPSCLIPEQGDVSLAATFAGPGSAAVAITFAGTASGQMLLGTSSPTDGVFTELTQCTRSCTTYVPVGDSLDIYAVTPSRFGGWTGDCTGGDGHCALQSVAGDTAATATFDKDDREIVTLRPDGMIPQAVAFAPDGDLVVAGGNVVTKLGIDGTVRWSTSSADAGQQVSQLAITTAGDVFTYGTRFERRSMTGAVLSSVPAGPPTCAFHGLTVNLRPALMSAPNGDLGIFTGGTVDGQATNELYVLAPDGSTRFTIDLGAGCTTAVAVGPDGIYQVLSGDQPEDPPTSFHVLRYDASGTQLPGSGPYTMTGGLPSLAIDGAGALAFNIGSMIGRIRPDGQLAFTASTDPLATGGGLAIAYDAAENVIAGYEVAGGIGGAHLEQRSPTGTVLWTLAKAAGQFFPGFSLGGVATSRTRQVAAVGKYTAFTGAIDVEVGWVAIYQMP